MVTSRWSCRRSVTRSRFSNAQDIRFMRGLINHVLVTLCYLMICNLSLCGLHSISEFYSKDLIMEMFTISYFIFFIYVIYLMPLSLTVSYTTRLILYLVWGESNYYPLNIIGEKLGYILIGTRILIFFVAFRGRFLMWVMPNPYYISLPNFIKILTLLIIFLGVILGCEFCYSNLTDKSNNDQFAFNFNFRIERKN